MDINQTANHLQRLAQPFDVIITQNGMERTLYTNLDPTDVEGLLNEIIETHKPDSLIIQERRRNGSTNVKQDKYNVSLGGLAPQNISAMHASTSNIPSDFKDYLISDLKEKNSKLEKRLEKVETENETLKTENFELVKENKYKDKEFELDKKAQEYEKSNGLAGIVDTVASNPALATIAATAIGRLMGIEVPAMGGLEAVPETAVTTTTPQEKIAGFIRNWIVKLDEATATQFLQLVNQISQNTEVISDLLEMIKSEDYAEN